MRGHLSSGDTLMRGHLSSGDTLMRGHLSLGDTSLHGTLIFWDYLCTRLKFMRLVFPVFDVLVDMELL